MRKYLTYPIVRAMPSTHTESSVDPNSVHVLTIVGNRLIRLCRQHNKILWPPLIAQRCMCKSKAYSTCKIQLKRGEKRRKTKSNRAKNVYSERIEETESHKQIKRLLKNWLESTNKQTMNHIEKALQKAKSTISLWPDIGLSPEGTMRHTFIKEFLFIDFLLRRGTQKVKGKERRTNSKIN